MTSTKYCWTIVQSIKPLRYAMVKCVQGIVSVALNFQHITIPATGSFVMPCPDVCVSACDFRNHLPLQRDI